jgi:serpin B
MSMSRFGKFRFAVFSLSIGSLALGGCGGGGSSTSQTRALPPAVAAAVRGATPVSSALVSADNSFGFDLFNQLTQQNPTGNVFISPTSVALALEIVENGAENGTLTAMAQTLHLPGMTPTDVDTANAALQASLVNPDPKIQLNIANSLWIQQGSTQVNPAFVQANTTYYGSNVGNLAGAPDNVNAWVSSATQGAITSILPPGNYRQDVCIVVNAVYFKGQWTTVFDPAQTVNAPFTLLSGATVTCPMMNQTNSFGYYRGTNFQLATLPYGSGRMSMIVALPDPGTSWQSFLTTVTAQNLNTWLSQTSPAWGSIGLPRFQSSYGADLIPALSALGMQVAFAPLQADLSGIAPGAYINFVQHKTFLQVDETGTTAAGVTGIGVATSAAPTPGFTMTMNHPFFCAIRDDKTGALLFMGTILDPTASN